MSFCEEIRRAVMASPRMKLPEIRQAMYKVAAAGQISETEVEALDTLINTRAAIPTTEKPTQRRCGSRPVRCLNRETALLGCYRPFATGSGSQVHPRRAGRVGCDRLRGEEARDLYPHGWPYCSTSGCL
jgi:hypothetical protein